MEPSVTVIIPTYNWSSVLPCSIGSVLRQTFTDFELLVVGDGCTDDSEAVVGRISDPRVRWINLPTNTGHQSEPNNEGLRQARGRYIAYLGHDDLWLPHHLSGLISALQEGADLAYGVNLMLILGHHGYKRVPAPPFEEYQPGRCISPTSVVHRGSVTEHVGGWRHYRELEEIDPDTELWQRAYVGGYRFAFVQRLTSIKFPAVDRKNVYKIRPSHEQAAWSQRIQSESNFETAELIRIIFAMEAELSPKPYRIVFREFLKETGKGIIRRTRRLMPRHASRKGQAVDARRKLKGLPRMP